MSSVVKGKYHEHTTNTFLGETQKIDEVLQR